MSKKNAFMLLALFLLIVLAVCMILFFTPDEEPLDDTDQSGQSSEENGDKENETSPETEEEGKQEYGDNVGAIPDAWRPIVE